MQDAGVIRWRLLFFCAECACIFKTKCEKSPMKKLFRYCPRVQSLLASPDFKQGFISIARMRCKQWSCPYCGTKNGDMWRAHLLHTLMDAMQDRRWVFITLTAHPNAHVSPMSSLRNLKRGWDKLYDRLRYWHGSTPSYIMTYEEHKSGAFHIHALVDMGEEYDAFGPCEVSGMTRKERIREEKRHGFVKHLKKLCEKVKIGRMVHATRIQEGETSGDNVRLAVGYVTKYFTKGMSDMSFPKGWRRIGTSRDIGSPKTKNTKEFKWSVRQFVTPKDVMQEPHFLISENRPLDASDFGDEGLYPSSEENA